MHYLLHSMNANNRLEERSCEVLETVFVGFLRVFFHLGGLLLQVGVPIFHLGDCPEVLLDIMPTSKQRYTTILLIVTITSHSSFKLTFTRTL